VDHTTYTPTKVFCNTIGSGNGTGRKPVVFTGRNLAHGHRGAGERAAIAAHLVLGEAELVGPTIIQAAAITRVCPQYVQTALRLQAPTRLRVARGTISLVDAAKANGLLSAWLAATPDEKAALGSIVGVTQIWDEAINPSI
jgi:hypothetical protein